MSENLNLVRSIYAAWERGDFSSADWADPEIEFVNADGPEPDAWKGRAAMAKAFGDVISAYTDYRVAADEYRQLDDERILVLVRSSGRGKASGLEIDQTETSEAVLFHLRDGKVTRLVTYWDCDRALADLGLKDG